MNRRNMLVAWSASLAIGLVASVSLMTNRAAVADDSPAAAAATGHCAFSLKNQWVGPLKACVDPSTAAQCAATGSKDENSNAVWSEGACPGAGRVGTCRKPDSSVHYYEGDAGGLEMGCGFQSGDWIKP